MQLKRQTFDAFLPPTACLETTRKQVNDIASANDTSAAAIIRAAVDLFLATYPQKTIGKTSVSEGSQSDPITKPVEHRLAAPGQG